MQSVKVLVKGQITLPKKLRKKLNIKEGDALVIKETREGIVLKKGKTIFDFAGTLPKPAVSIEEMREKAIEEAVKERA